VIHLQIQINRGIVVREVAADLGPLPHPVKPESSRRVMNTVAPDHRINPSVKFDATLFLPAEKAADMNT